jgi:chemotaxis signal transduction protein
MALCCRLGSQRYALPISEVSGVFELKSVLAIPARAKGWRTFGVS